MRLDLAAAALAHRLRPLRIREQKFEPVREQPNILWIDDKAVHPVLNDFLRGALRAADHWKPVLPGFEIDNPKSFL